MLEATVRSYAVGAGKWPALLKQEALVAFAIVCASILQEVADLVIHLGRILFKGIPTALRKRIIAVADLIVCEGSGVDVEEIVKVVFVHRKIASVQAQLQPSVIVQFFAMGEEKNDFSPGPIALQLQYVR